MAGYISITDSEENEKGYIFWNFSNSRLMVQNGLSLIQPLVEENKTNEEIRSAVKDEVATQILLNSLGGRVGIGTEEPKYTLDVNGDLGISGSLVMKKISDYDKPQEYFVEPGSDISGSLKGNLGLGTKTPTEKITIKSVNDLTVTPNVLNKSTIRFENWNKTTEETVNKVYSLGIIDSKFTLLDSNNAVVFSIDEELFTLNKRFFISELTVDRITINQNISYKSIVVDDDFSTDILTANTGTITNLSVSNTLTTKDLEITNALTANTGTIIDLSVSNKLTTKDLEVTNSVTLPTLLNINMSETTSTKDLVVSDTTRTNKLFVNNKEIVLENLSSKFDSLLDTTETQECDNESELYQLNTGCIASSLGSISISNYHTLIDSEDDLLWTDRSVTLFTSSSNLPLKRISKTFSYEFYFRFQNTNVYSEVPILQLQKQSDSNFDCNVSYVDNTKKFKLKFGTTFSNYIEILSDPISEVTKPLDQWRHLKVSIDMNNNLFNFYLDGVEQTSLTGSGTFDLYEILDTDEFYFRTGNDQMFTDIIFIHNYDTSLEHFTNNKPWSSSNTLIGKNCSFHLDNNGNFWAKKVW